MKQSINRDDLAHAVEAHVPFDAAPIDHRMPGHDGDERLNSLPLVLLTSTGQACDRDSLRQLGFTDCLLKPVARLHLLKCLQSILLADVGAASIRSQRIAVRQCTEAAGVEQRARVLLAEDNLVNQKVAARAAASMPVAPSGTPATGNDAADRLIVARVRDRRRFSRRQSE